MIRTTLLLMFLLVITKAFSIQAVDLLERNAWNTFEGRLGFEQIQMSLFLFDDGKVKGNYVFRDSTKKNQLTGYLRLKTVHLIEEKSAYKFALEIFSDSTDRLMGNWIDEINDDLLPVNIRLSAINFGYAERRYDEMFGTADEIESFMGKVKKSILSDDIHWLAEHIEFPINSMDKKEFIKNYKEIIDSNLKERIRHAYTTNLFDKNSKVMLGDGAVWVGNKSGSNSEKYDFIIVSL